MAVQELIDQIIWNINEKNTVNLQGLRLGWQKIQPLLTSEDNVRIKKEIKEKTGKTFTINYFLKYT